MVDRVHEVVVPVADLRQVAVEHSGLAVVLHEDTGPVEVLDDDVAELAGALD